MDDMILETPGSTDPTSDQYVRRAYDRHDGNRREMEVLGQPGGSDAEAEHSSCGKNISWSTGGRFRGAHQVHVGMSSSDA